MICKTGYGYTAFIPIVEAKPTRVVSRQMGYRHRDFFRNLRTAMEGRAYKIIGKSSVIVREGDKQLEIELREESERGLSPSLRLPVTPVVFRFFGYSDREADEFLRAIDRHYQRGGG
uniref:Uncharacterized protein n=1 Tax=Candidatus Kentrum sp. SD TaxID=2126332 RepID=A0A450Z7Q1_9GAMM|nr:MAG: hypothetical protein BECKSD772F_GA0070984_12601 [Candidatus Kentron sp. SD]VFK49823.1 MAG: hypothetical protein BECKSD772E_GA0070983_12491 [Candidatus Kentron sp. SD]VFK79989.1 MAG: hypothetical protein BECKSD772D_GA0070982_10784 [Candidatus Kentron sp. SD]